MGLRELRLIVVLYRGETGAVINTGSLSLHVRLGEVFLLEEENLVRVYRSKKVGPQW